MAKKATKVKIESVKSELEQLQKQINERKAKITAQYQKNVEYDKKFEHLTQGCLLSVKNYSEIDEFTFLNPDKLNNEQLIEYHQKYRLKENRYHYLGTSHINCVGLNNFEGHPYLSDKDAKYEFDTNLVIPNEILIFMKYINSQIPRYPHHFYLPGSHPNETKDIRSWAPRILCYKPDNCTFIQLPSIILNILTHN